MDRIISLLAALVGLIALGGAILVHVNGDAQRAELATQIAGLRAALGAPTPAADSATPAPASEAAAARAVSSSSQLASADIVPSQPIPVASASSAEPDSAAQLSALQDRIAELERINSEQASELVEARAQLAALPSSSTAPSSALAVAEASAPAPLTPPAPSTGPASSSSAAPSAEVAGNSADCIPLGTRFMGKTGDSFPICKTTAVVKVAAVNDGTALIDGAGPVAAGSFADLSTKGCTVMVFSADLTGYAEMRVTCE